MEKEANEGKDGRKSNFKRGKPPDKRRHHMEMNEYTELIQKKEALLSSLNAPRLRKSISSVHGSREELLTKLRSLKSEKEEKMKQKQVIDSEIKTLNQQVAKKNETCLKLQANVKYKDEQRTNNAIKHLERHLGTHQLKLSEEKKLVCEIDALKRSKKTLSEYLAVKQEVDQLRQRQSSLRSERDTLIRETHDIRAVENDVKVSLDSLKEENKGKDEEKKPTVDRDALKREIDGLYEKRRELHDNYKQASASYHGEQKQAEKDLQQSKAEQRRDETRLNKMFVDRARQEKRVVEPKLYKEEKGICCCLIQYLEPLVAHYSCENEEIDGNKSSPRYLEIPKCEGNIPEEGSFLMKKHDEDNLGGLFVQSHRRLGRKGSRKGRKSKDSGQKLVLHPHVFEQFFKLNLEPPSTYADVNGILERLREKKAFYETESSTKSSQTLPVIPERSPFGKAGVLGDERSTERGQGEHEIAIKAEDEVGEVKPEILKNENEINEAKHEVTKDGHEFVQAHHETKRSEHESLQLGSESVHGGHEDKQQEHGNIETLHEKDEPAHEHANEEEDIFKNERSSCEDEEIATENLLNRAEEKEINERACSEEKDILSSINCPTIITDTLEKGIDSINTKETSPEIQVRVT